MVAAASLGSTSGRDRVQIDGPHDVERETEQHHGDGDRQSRREQGLAPVPGHHHGDEEQEQRQDWAAPGQGVQPARTPSAPAPMLSAWKIVKDAFTSGMRLGEREPVIEQDLLDRLDEGAMLILTAPSEMSTASLVSPVRTATICSCACARGRDPGLLEGVGGHDLVDARTHEVLDRIAQRNRQRRQHLAST